ncbi:MAG: DUF5995 family protein, partial [Bacteroidota bacterium]
MRLPATTIIEVLARLDEIIDTARTNNDPLGYFSYVYRRTTAAVKAAIDAGRFADNPRMETFDVAFANLYLEAYEQFHCGDPCSASWELAFRAAKDRKAMLQHVLLGMNAHINLDLGVAAGRLMIGEELDELEADFCLVNDILQEITEELQERVARVSPLFRLVDRLGKQRDEHLLDFSMRAAREQAWVLAHQVWLAGDQQAEVVQRVDANVARLATRINAPGTRVTRWLWGALARTEGQDVGRNIDRLRL